MYMIKIKRNLLNITQQTEGAAERGTQMVSPKEVIKKWERHFNERDAESLAGLYHEDATNLQISIGVPLIGKAAILEDMRKFFSNIPDNVTNIFNIVESGEWVAIEWTGGGTFLPTGVKFEFRGCGFFQVTDGKIKLQRGYWDMLQWQKAIQR
jgi:steroid delta-isomerase-like uncharacterized protein